MGTKSFNMPVIIAINDIRAGQFPNYIGFYIPMAAFRHNVDHRNTGTIINFYGLSVFVDSCSAAPASASASDWIKGFVDNGTDFTTGGYAKSFFTPLAGLLAIDFHTDTGVGALPWLLEGRAGPVPGVPGAVHAPAPRVAGRRRGEVAL